MSTLPVLVKALAEVDGRDRATIEYFGRTIREAGYIATGKRGMGAPKMTIREAGNLILALNGSDGPKEAPIAIDRFRSLRQFLQGDSRAFEDYLDKSRAVPLPIKDAMEAYTFGDALDSLIEGVPELVRWCFAVFCEQWEDIGDELFTNFLRMDFFGVLITLKRYGAEIELFRGLGSERTVESRILFTMDPGRMTEGFYGRLFPDRKVSVSFGLLTLVAAWRGLNPDVDIIRTITAEG